MREALGTFVLGYPLVMALIWVGLALIFAWWREWGEAGLALPAEGCLGPPVSVLIPCFNEGANLSETLAAALRIEWPEWEVVAIDDGSSDDTGDQLDAWAAVEPRLRVIHLARNQGKALALRAGALLARHEWLVCIDGDALLEPSAVAWMVRHLQEDPRVGAVTGNPRIRNRTTLLGRLQVGEFAMIVGLIKRAQTLLGGLFCVSGVVAAFRRSALHEVGYWNPERLTEDIDITWRLQRAGWRVCYEPRALVWILMPESLRGLWKQRLRWAEGGVQVLLANLDLLVRPRQWRLLPFLVEPLLSLLWAWSIVAAGLLAALAPLREGWPAALGTLPALVLPHGLALALLPACALQFGVSVWLERPYDRGLARNGIWMIWYPLVFWLITFSAALVSLPRALARREGARARWVSPDRGVRA
jgi:biofilm PGA synthesis N-glycosyltransferase PgaC